MAIVDTMTKSSFVHAFRSARPDNFTWTALEALYNYYDNLSEDTGVDVEYDPIAMCCEWTEYDNAAQALAAYDNVESIEDLEADHYVIELGNGGYVIHN